MIVVAYFAIACSSALARAQRGSARIAADESLTAASRAQPPAARAARAATTSAVALKEQSEVERSLPPPAVLVRVDDVRRLPLFFFPSALRPSRSVANSKSLAAVAPLPPGSPSAAKALSLSPSFSSTCVPSPFCPCELFRTLVSWACLARACCA